MLLCGTYLPTIYVYMSSHANVYSVSRNFGNFIHIQYTHRTLPVYY